LWRWPVRFLDPPFSIVGVSLGVAGPVNKGNVQGTNFPWKIIVEEIKKGPQVKRVSLINDLEANAISWRHFNIKIWPL